MSRTLTAVIESDNGNYQVQTLGATNFVVALVVQLEAALEMQGLKQQREAVLACIKSFDVGRLKSEIVFRGKF